MSDGVCYKAHTLSVEQNLELLGSNESIGLSVQQVASNILLYGANTIPVQKLSTTWEKVWAQVNSVLIYILVTGSVISFSFQHTVDGSVIIGVVVINVSLGYFMESKAENATEVLKGMLSPSSLVLREGNKQIIEATGLSVGDIFFLQAGDIVPADGRVLHAADLSVLESPLTGESHPIIKNSEAVTLVDAPLAERKCIVYSGTQVLKGTASCVVIAVGKNCEIGKISGLLTEIEVEKTPLLVQLEKFGLILSVIIVCLALAAFGIAHSSGYTVGDALALSIGIAVAAIPEGLPSCITITFAIGVHFMAARHAIVKSLPAVETLGNVNVICSDKTGTLTINKMTVKEMHTAMSTIEFTDDGTIKEKEPGRTIVWDTQTMVARDNLLVHMLPGILCNDGSIVMEAPLETPENVNFIDGDGAVEVASSSLAVNQSAAFQIQGDPTETCILSLAVSLEESAQNIKGMQKSLVRVAEIPFDSDRKYMATMHYIDSETCAKLRMVGEISRYLYSPADVATSSNSAVPVEGEDGKFKVVFIKGAPEKIISFCEQPHTVRLDHLGRIVNVDTAFTQYWLSRANSGAEKGMRVLGFAFKIVPLDFEFDSQFLIPCSGFTMTALVCIMDPPRPEAIVAIKQAQDAGICVKMITGDHPVTALAIGEMLGLHVSKGLDVELGGEKRAITGNDLDQLIISSMAAFDETVMNNDIFARTTPEHKLRIVQSLQRQGCVCCMTGDGVNDAPALKAANIGVAMGITGTEVAKNAADVVLTDDNFAAIVDAIRIGRCTYNNLIKIITFVLPTNGGQAFSILGALIIGVQVPISALQILWVNMITSVTLGLVLAFDKPGADILMKKPRRKDKRLFGRFLAWRLVFVTALLTIAILGVFHWEKGRIVSLNLLRTIAVNTLSIAQIGYLFNCRSLRNSVSIQELLCGNNLIYLGILLVIICQILFTYAPPLQYVFHTESMDGESWGKIALVAVAVFLLIETEKWVSNQLGNHLDYLRPRRASYVTVTVGGL